MRYTLTPNKCTKRIIVRSFTTLVLFSMLTLTLIFTFGACSKKGSSDKVSPSDDDIVGTYAYSANRNENSLDITIDYVLVLNEDKTFALKMNVSGYNVGVSEGTYDVSGDRICLSVDPEIESNAEKYNIELIKKGNKLIGSEEDGETMEFVKK